METVPVERVRSSAPPTPPASRGAGRWVLLVAGLLIVAQLAVRSWIAAGRSYYGDDLRILHLADRNSLLSWSYLTYDYDGQFMPGGLLLAGLVERVAPVEWWPAALTLIGMQLLASLALLRLLRVLVGDRPLLLVPLAFGLFTTLTIGSFTWWAAALNSLPVQIGLAVFLAEAVLLARTGSRRYAVRGTLVLAITFCFYLKAVLIPWVGFGVVVAVLLGEGRRFTILEAWRRCRALWIGSLLVTAVWASVYLNTRTRPPASGGSVGDVLLTVETGFRVLAASVVGGPSGWWNTRPASPAALGMPLWSVQVGAAALIAACLWTCVRRRGAVTVWALVVLAAAGGLVLAGIGRGALGLGGVAPLAARYYPVEAVLLPAAGALLATLPSRGGPGQRSVRGSRAVVAVMTAATVAFMIAAAMSSLEQARAWKVDRTGEYLAVARESLAAAGPAPMFDQPLPVDIIPPLAAPNNTFSVMLSPLEDRPRFADWTSELRMLDEQGRLRPAQVVPGPLVVEGPVPGCGWAIDADGTSVGLQGPLPVGDWTAELRYVAAADSTVVVSLDSGRTVEAPVTAGAGTLYVRLDGGGPTVQLTTPDAATGLCVSGGVVGSTALR